MLLPSLCHSLCHLNRTFTAGVRRKEQGMEVAPAPRNRKLMTAGAQAVKNCRRGAQAAANSTTIDSTSLSANSTTTDSTSLFDRLAFVLLAVIFRQLRPNMRSLWMLRLVCREWTQTVDEHLRRVAHRYWVYPSAHDETDLFPNEKAQANLFGEMGWMTDAIRPLQLNTPRFRNVRVFRLDDFPHGTHQDWLYSLVIQLASLPHLEEIGLGDNGWHGMSINTEFNEDVHFEILRVLFAQLKRVHSFRGTLGLSEHATFFLINAIKDMPALRNIDFTGTDGGVYIYTNEPSEEMALAMQTMSELCLERIRGLEHDDLLWTHCEPSKLIHLRSIDMQFYSAAEEEADAEKDDVTNFVKLIDNVRLIPRLEELSLRLVDNIGMFCTENWDSIDDRAPANVAFCRALQSQLKKLVAKVASPSSTDSLRGNSDVHNHEYLVEWALGIIAPHIRRVEFEYI